MLWSKIHSVMSDLAILDCFAIGEVRVGSDVHVLRVIGIGGVSELLIDWDQSRAFVHVGISPCWSSREAAY